MAQKVLKLTHVNGKQTTYHGIDCLGYVIYVLILSPINAQRVVTGATKYCDIGAKAQCINRDIIITWSSLSHITKQHMQSS